MNLIYGNPDEMILLESIRPIVVMCVHLASVLGYAVKSQHHVCLLLVHRFVRLELLGNGLTFQRFAERIRYLHSTAT